MTLILKEWDMGVNKKGGKMIFGWLKMPSLFFNLWFLLHYSTFFASWQVNTACENYLRNAWRHETRIDEPLGGSI
jgi:hypothetical protein